MRCWPNHQQVSAIYHSNSISCSLHILNASLNQTYRQNVYTSTHHWPNYHLINPDANFLFKGNLSYLHHFGTHFISLLMPWLIVSPGHQQPERTGQTRTIKSCWCPDSSSCVIVCIGGFRTPQARNAMGNKKLHGGNRQCSGLSFKKLLVLIRNVKNLNMDL